MNKTTEWKRVDLSKDTPDFAGAVQSNLEIDGSAFLALTLKLKSGRTVRIRKGDYSVSVEEPSIPMDKKYIVKVGELQSKLFETEAQASAEADKYQNAEIVETNVPKAEPKQLDDLPF